MKSVARFMGLCVVTSVALAVGPRAVGQERVCTPAEAPAGAVVCASTYDSFGPDTTATGGSAQSDLAGGYVVAAVSTFPSATAYGGIALADPECDVCPSLAYVFLNSWANSCQGPRAPRCGDVHLHPVIGVRAADCRADVSAHIYPSGSPPSAEYTTC